MPTDTFAKALPFVSMLWMLVGHSLTATAAVIMVPDDYEAVPLAIAAAQDGDEVRIQPGTYGDGGVSFEGKAITVGSIDPEDPRIVASTVIDGLWVYGGVSFSDGEGPDSILEGLTITRGSRPLNRGAGIACFESSPTIRDCRVVVNWAGEPGGGISCRGGEPTIVRCLIAGNQSDTAGGGLGIEGSDPTIVRCVIADNWGYDGGGGVWSRRANPYFENCVIAENESVYYPGGGVRSEQSGTVRMVNSIVWGNIGGSFSLDGGGIDASYSIVEAGWPGEGNLDLPPRFVNQGVYDFRIAQDSPAIDAGDPAFNAPPRGGDRIDMGAIERLRAWIEFDRIEGPR